MSFEPPPTKYYSVLQSQAWGHVATCISARPQQHLRSFSVAGSSCFKEGRLPVAVLGMHACPTAQEQLDSGCLAAIGRQVERRCAILQGESLHVRTQTVSQPFRQSSNLRAQYCA